MDRTDAAVALGDLAADQGGLLTSRQALAAGVTRQQLARLADAGALERIRHGVYRVAGAPPQDLDELRAAWLSFDPERTAAERIDTARSGDQALEVVSHRSAALIHGLGDLDAPELEFSVPSRRQPRDRHIRLHQHPLAPDQWTLVDGLPVTTVLTTIADLAAAHIDGGHLAGVVRDAVTSRHTDLQDVARALTPHAHRYGAPLAQGLVLTQRLLDEAGLPASVRDSAALQRLAPATTDLQLGRHLAEQIRQLQGAADLPAIRELLGQIAAVTEIPRIQVLDDDTLARLLAAAAPRTQQLAAELTRLQVPTMDEATRQAMRELTARIASSGAPAAAAASSPQQETPDTAAHT